MAILGTCLCGAVRYEVEGPFDPMMHCHCSMCRKHHGSAFATFVSAPLASFRWVAGEEQIATYASSEQGVRRFCPTCGSVAPTLVPEIDRAICPAGNLVGDLPVRPQYHVFVGSKAPWFQITDELPQYAEYPPEFGASGVARAPRVTKPGVVTGSCLCGAVTYEVSGQPKRMLNCHCWRCRRSRSAAHATNLAHDVAEFAFTSGAENVRPYKVPEAQRFTIAFCKQCGSATPCAPSSIAIVPAGTLDNDPGARASDHIFVGSKASWFTITDQLPQWETVPSVLSLQTELAKRTGDG